MNSKIEELINQIESYISSCNYVTLSNTYIKVNKEEIEDLIRELKAKTPDEIKQYKAILDQKDEIINNAKEKAEKMLSDVKKETNQLIDEHQIKKQAFDEAQGIVSQATVQADAILKRATYEAENMKSAAVQYTDGLLANVEKVLQDSIDSTNKHYEGMLGEISAYSEMIRSNREELQPMLEQYSQMSFENNETSDVPNDVDNTEM